MIGLDTNVLVRYIMQDDAKQSPLASKLVESLTVDAPGLVTLVIEYCISNVLFSVPEVAHETVRKSRGVGT